MSLSDLRVAMHAGTGSQPMMIPLAAATAIEHTLRHAPVITGTQFRKLRTDHPAWLPHRPETS